MFVVKFVMIYGGFGFFGWQIVWVLVVQGWCVCVVVWCLNEVGVVCIYGVFGQIELVFCNVCDDVLVVVCMIDVQVVINCVGILVGEGKNIFDVIYDEVVGCIVWILVQQGMLCFVYVLVLGVDVVLDSFYVVLKGWGEVVVLVVWFDVVILCLLIIFGLDDNFFNCIVSMMCFGLVLMVLGVDMLVQLVYVMDVVNVVVMVVEGKVEVGIYELGGLDVMIMCEVVRLVLQVMGCCCVVMVLFGLLGGGLVVVLDMVQIVSGGLLINCVLMCD